MTTRAARHTSTLPIVVLLTVGLALVALVASAAARGGVTGAPSAAAAAPTPTAVPSPDGTPSGGSAATPPAPGVVVSVPAECLQLAADARAATRLLTEAAGAAAQLDAGRLADLVREMGATSRLLDAEAATCQGSARSASTDVPGG